MVRCIDFSTIGCVVACSYWTGCACCVMHADKEENNGDVDVR